MTKYAVMEATVTGKSSLGEAPKPNNDLSESSVIVLKHSLFALAATEFFKNGKTTLFAEDVRIKDESTGREFSFTLTGKEV
jgi:hypothetical protein